MKYHFASKSFLLWECNEQFWLPNEALDWLLTVIMLNMETTD